MADPVIAFIHAIHLAEEATEAPSPTNKMDGITDAPVNFTADSVDIGYLGQDGGWKRSMTTSKSFQIPISGHLMRNDPTHVLLRDAFLQNETVYLLIVEDADAAPGSQGHRYPVKVSSYEEGRTSTDVVTVSATLTGQGAPSPL
ncbi:phage tail tube protein [Myxococcus sp. Y35]|uniref:phage tail tube protein n=1 Tax=Pseudomyxococcus flavus TaxID=3115648 RepID=UPI003CE99ECD